MAKPKTTKKRTSSSKKKTTPKSTVKKVSSRKKASTKKATRATTVKADATTATKTIKRPNLSIGVKKALLFIVPIVLIFFVVDSAIQYINNSYSIAVVNGKRITKRQYYDEVNKVVGNDVLNALIQDELIRQEAEKEGIQVSEDEINQQYEEIARNAGGEDKLEELLTSQYNLTVQELKDRIAVQIMSEKLAEAQMPEIKESDVEAFFNQYKDQLYPGEEDVKFEDKKDEITQYYKDTQYNALKQDLINKLMSEASIQNNLKNKPKFRIFGSLRNIIDNLSKLNNKTSD